MDINYKLLENGLDFVLSSANQLKQLTDAKEEKTKKRLLKYSLLHLFSGIELILKYRLLQEHWTYVYADMNKADKQAFLGGDFQSASCEELFARLSKLCNIEIKQHLKDEVNKLKELRNKTMHFEVSGNVNAIENHINKNITFIIRFISDYITISDLSDEEQDLLSEIKIVLKKLTKHYNNAILLAEKVAKERGISGCLETCMECGEAFLWKSEGSGECIFCGEKYDGEDLARLYLYEQGIDEYSTVKDGGEYPCYTCPECGSHSFVISHDYDFARCFTCEIQYTTSEVAFCSWCNEPFIGDEESSGGMCPSCWEYRLSKD